MEGKETNEWDLEEEEENEDIDTLRAKRVGNNTPTVSLIISSLSIITGNEGISLLDSADVASSAFKSDGNSISLIISSLSSSDSKVGRSVNL